MNKEKQSIMPEMHLFPRLEKAARVIGSLFCMHQLSTRSDHFQNTGGGPMIDRELYDQEKLFTEDVAGWGTVEE